MEVAPNRARLLRLSKARTAPMAAPAKATSGKDLEPISSSCRSSSRPSKGRLTEARTTCHAKRPRSPNHSRKRLIRLQTEVIVDRMSDVGCRASGLNQRARNPIPCLPGTCIVRSRMAAAMGQRETNILRARDITLRIQKSVPKGTQNAGQLCVLGICLWYWTRSCQTGKTGKNGPTSGAQRKPKALDGYTQIWEVYT